MLPVRFHLPGLRYNFPLNMIWVSLLRQHPEYFREGVEIGSFFGCFPFALWNGGREIDPGDQCDAGFIHQTIRAINQAGIPIRYTFTNPLLTEEELKDDFCNFCLKAAEGFRNEVLVFSPLLEAYIRKNYPSYIINSTTCKEIKTVEALNEEMEKDYRYVVLDYNLNGNWDFIGKLAHPEKLEVLINATCTPNCPRRGEHYREIARRQRIVLKNRKLPPERRKPLPEWKCRYGIDNTVYSIQDYPTVVKPDQIWQEYLPRGINNFKIEGRTANLFNLVDTYCFYMAKPEHADEVRFQVLRNLEQSGIIAVRRPRPQAFVLPETERK
ncbi:MAG: hypothetical protein K6C95_00315 [Lachnospiraceae bacterium]|nr:hypothetical protein [Lachnospiraceae bacterium]